MNKEIFKKAKIMTKYIKIEIETDKIIEAILGNTDLRMRIWKENNQIHSSCTCKHFSNTQADCSHLLALKAYLTYFSGKFEVPVMLQ